MKIGIIGSGNIGGTLGRHWAKVGHDVMFSSRNPAALKPMADLDSGTIFEPNAPLYNKNLKIGEAEALLKQIQGQLETIASIVAKSIDAANIG